MLIRAITHDDVLSIRALEQRSETAAHWAQREYDALFVPDAPARIALVAASESDVAQLYGFVIVRCAPGDWEIENLVVAQEHQRLGIGTKLIQELLHRAQCAATSVLLEVRESNFAARRLYEKLGFSEQGRRSNYYRDPAEDALLLRISTAIL